MVRLLSCLVAALALVQPAQPPARRLTVTTGADAFAILRIRVEDAHVALRAAALDVIVDGRTDQHIVLTPGAPRPQYEALLGPLAAGTHDVRLEPSALWKWDAALRVVDAAVDVLPPRNERLAVLTHAPAIALRADTIGTASDLPLMLYVEDDTTGGSRWLRYTAIFSHEDGGTPGVALMARWGRTTDIELAYEVEVRDGRAVQARYQGPDHRVMPIARLDARPPLLLVSTLNNMFLERGHSPVVVRMVPQQVDLSGRTRESVVDEHPWIYSVMARELEDERPPGVGDPRDYLYVDVRLDSRSAGIALGARSAGGTTRWSDRGRADLVVSRQGELRIAIPAPAAERVEALAVRCDPRPEPGASAADARCAVELRKAVRLDREHRPVAMQLPTGAITLEPGTAHETPIAAAKIGR